MDHYVVQGFGGDDKEDDKSIEEYQCLACGFLTNAESKMEAITNHSLVRCSSKPTMRSTKSDDLDETVDLVRAPPHYRQGSIECIDAIQAALTPEEWRGFLKGQVLKYCWRERWKGGKQDVSKSIFYSKKLEEAL